MHEAVEQWSSEGDGISTCIDMGYGGTSHDRKATSKPVKGRDAGSRRRCTGGHCTSPQSTSRGIIVDQIVRAANRGIVDGQPGDGACPEGQRATDVGRIVHIQIKGPRRTIDADASIRRVDIHDDRGPICLGDLNRRCAVDRWIKKANGKFKIGHRIERSEDVRYGQGSSCVGPRGVRHCIGTVVDTCTTIGAGEYPRERGSSEGYGEPGPRGPARQCSCAGNVELIEGTPAPLVINTPLLPLVSPTTVVPLDW